ncbi:hypothetical protein Tco_0238821, partial [Tanacetum coccineum]
QTHPRGGADEMVVLWWLWARGGGDGEGRVSKSECRDRRDRKVRSIFGLRWNTHRKTFPVTGGGGGGGGSGGRKIWWGRELNV